MGFFNKFIATIRLFPGWGAIRNWPPDQTVPDESHLWSDPPRPKYPLIRQKCARNTVCALSALETVSDQTFPDGKDLWSDHNQTIVQTIVLPWPSSNPDHCPDDCVLKSSSYQTIVRSKSPHRTNFVIIYSFHTKWCLHCYIHLKKRLFLKYYC